ncbi:hypothetical protein Ddye_029455 [Dipteronia dyeriana]|uniref:Uncharacterized protein n=1 Tax=Dipteronia dyeriana TaxID=168575 RepID=A0AAD9TF57_9ROSI|nr:hypothetical protein Ddye_029455 [Dipteronia dyeriana]
MAITNRISVLRLSDSQVSTPPIDISSLISGSPLLVSELLISAAHLYCSTSDLLFSAAVPTPFLKEAEAVLLSFWFFAFSDV